MYSGDSNRSAVLYDSLRADSVPFEGVISDGSSIRIDFLAEEPAAATAFNIRFEGDPPCQGGPEGSGRWGLQEGSQRTPSPWCWARGFSEPPVAAAALGNIFPSKCNNLCPKLTDFPLHFQNLWHAIKPCCPPRACPLLALGGRTQPRGPAPSLLPKGSGVWLNLRGSAQRSGC